MLADESRRDVFGRMLTIWETAGPFPLMAGIGIVSVLVILGFMRKSHALLALLLIVAGMAGQANETADSALSMIRWIMIVMLAVHSIFVRTHPGVPILMLMAYVVLGFVFSLFSQQMLWSIQSGTLFLASTLVAVTAGGLMADRQGLRRFYWLYLPPALLWTSLALIYLPDFLAGRMEYGYGRFQGFADSSGVFALSGSIVLPCLLWQSMQPVRVWYRVLAIVTFAMVLILLTLATQRTALFSAVIGCVPLLLSANMRGFAVLGTIAVVLWVMSMQIFGAMNKNQGEFITKRMSNTSTTGRYELWMSSVDELLREPFIGHGFGSDRWLAEGGHLDHKQRPHNWYIVAWHNTGVFGLMLLLATLGVAILRPVGLLLFSYADGELKSISRLIVGQLLGLCAYGMTESMGSPSNLSTLTLCFALVASGRLMIIYQQEQAEEAEREYEEYELELSHHGGLAHQV